MTSIYNNLSAAFEAADVSGDISWWSVNCGAEMARKWPEFEVRREWFRGTANRFLKNLSQIFLVWQKEVQVVNLASASNIL